ncbi:MAG TPA: glycosyltransferase family 39 protein [Nitrosomonas europaea]|uniref:glycosyltransferase family 39 protein n=1 Tax=Nitrosomonas europaea TaxID=915 RepID=UPI0024900004|nr:glycosyltransferase family 39 protein [Nitrosomonas europaea]HRN82765.1 glycosyltransferase family 39 protein [Nitrosomonas europaea]HRO55797.1 glycosyltransferase family 39 protein [Nitrosomonas europaea]HRQ09226.1 glycosyltransferase family 39 protein [Nitrosomonas europaea]HUM73525.1 glycosyltransferase family 39 protein [Nitrosomonas europaea]
MAQRIAKLFKEDWPWLILILSVGFLLRIAAILSLNHESNGGDELAYISMALNLINGGEIKDNMGNHAMYNVGYPLFILAPVFFFFGENIFAARICNVLLGGVAIILCYLVAKEAGAGKIGRLTAAGILALYLPTGVYAVYILKENLMTPLMLGVIWCALRLAHQPSKKAAAGCGILFGLLALTGNAALSLAAAVMLALVLAPTTTSRKATFMTLIFAIAVAISAPWMIRNAFVIGSPVMNTNGGFNLYLGNNPAATGYFVSIADTPRGSTWGDLRKTGEVQASETLKQEAIAWIKDHPVDFLTLAAKKAVYFWTPPVHEGKGEQSPIEKIIRISWLIQFIVIVAAALATLLIKELRNKQLLILWLAICSYTAVHMLFYVIFRYREPIMPITMIMAASTIEFLFLKRLSSTKNLSQ